MSATKSINTLSKDEVQAVIYVGENCVSDVLDSSMALLPLANFAMIDYTLEFVLRSGIKDIIVFSTDMSHELQSHLSYASGTQSTVSLHDAAGKTLGDVLREIDSKSLIVCECFVLISAGFVSNSPLLDSISFHRKLHAKDKSNVMTLCLIECDVNHPSRCRTSDVCIAYEKYTRRLISFEKLKGDVSNVDIDMAMLEFDDIVWHLDCLDCGVAICSKDIPALFQDNFDFQSRDAMIKDILQNEIHGLHMSVSIIENSYAAVVSDFNSYISITNDVLARWAYPLTLDCGVSSCSFDVLYTCLMNNVYLHGGSNKCSRASLLANVAVGSGCSIHETAKISGSVLGNGCCVGERVSIENCILWNNVTIENGCSLSGAIICSNVVIHQKCTVMPRSIICKNYELNPGSSVSSGSLLRLENCGSVQGKRASTLSSKSYDDSDASANEVWPEWYPLTVETVAVSEGSEGEVQSDMDGEGAQSEEDDENQMFYNEVLESLQRGADEKVLSDTMRLEVNSSKHAYNIAISDVFYLLTKAVIEVAFYKDKKDPNAADAVWKSAKPILDHMHALLKSYLLNNVSGQLVSLKAFEGCSNHYSTLPVLMPKILYLLYDEDVYSEQAVLQWYNDLVKTKSPLSEKVAPFTKWLQEAEEESDEDD